MLLNNNDNKYVKKLIFNDRTDLCDIMDKHRSDKASQIISSGHNYTRYYNYLFKDLRTKNINVFLKNENYLSPFQKGLVKNLLRLIFQNLLV